MTLASDKVVAAVGECRRCYRWLELGNGLCVVCWDRVGDIR